MNAPLKIQFERSGGFAGMKIRFSLDEKDLSAEERERLLEMLRQAGVFDQPRLPIPPSGADRFTYRLTIANRGEVYTIEVDEDSMPQEMRPLVEYLNLKARRALRPSR
ncbi:MAG: protealysin inhibitor emfourin [Anaerolineales bacterium]